MKIGTIELLALSKLPGVGNATLREICTAKINFSELRSSKKADIIKFFKGAKKEESYSEFVNDFNKYIESAEYEIEKYKLDNIEVVSYNDVVYPPLYRLLDDFPPIIYVKGNIQLLTYDRNIAVIGTRENSTIGARIAKNTATHFAQNGYNIVSGLAIGIDCIAHQAALDVDGLTTAILVDIKKIYPSQNKELAHKILESGGLLVSEYKPGAAFHKSQFVERDRLQSGLSIAIFPIETDIKGGTMHTVSFAKQQKRLIYCPDLLKDKDIDLVLQNPKSRGIIEMIKNGTAIPYTREDYPFILKKLHDKAKELIPSITDLEHISPHSSISMKTDQNIDIVPAKANTNLEYGTPITINFSDDIAVNEQQAEVQLHQKLENEETTLIEKIASLMKELQKIRKKKNEIKLKNGIN